MGLASIGNPQRPVHSDLEIVPPEPAPSGPSGAPVAFFGATSHSRRAQAALREQAFCFRRALSALSDGAVDSGEQVSHFWRAPSALSVGVPHFWRAVSALWK